MVLGVEQMGDSWFRRVVAHSSRRKAGEVEDVESTFLSVSLTVSHFAEPLLRATSLSHC